LRSFLQADLRGTPFIGDSLTDLQTAQASDCLPILVKTGKGQHTLSTLHDPLPLVFSDLAAATQWIIEGNLSLPIHQG
jgi:D-glycero-D-manno-heptose 1,7-bisphosphate phosphatase